MSLVSSNHQPRNWIKVEVIRPGKWARDLGFTQPHFRVYCKNCGHDDFVGSVAVAIDRGRAMHRDHIPGSPDRSLSCYGWAPVEAGEECCHA